MVAILSIERSVVSDHVAKQVLKVIADQSASHEGKRQSEVITVRDSHPLDIGVAAVDLCILGTLTEKTLEEMLLNLRRVVPSGVSLRVGDRDGRSITW